MAGGGGEFIQGLLNLGYRQLLIGLSDSTMKSPALTRLSTWTFNTVRVPLVLKSQAAFSSSGQGASAAGAQYDVACTWQWRWSPCAACFAAAAAAAWLCCSLL